MELTPLNTIFDIEYGNKFDLNKMIIKDKSKIAFVGRTEKNNGVTAYVEEVSGISPYDPGFITVALGGAILESNLQPFPFYTAQNVAVLKPKNTMSDEEKLFYAFAIEANKFRYGAFGREANRSLRTLLVPKSIPKMFMKKSNFEPSNESILFPREVTFPPTLWKSFKYKDIFDIQTGIGPLVKSRTIENGAVPFVSTTSESNGFSYYYAGPAKHAANLITVSNDGSVGEAFYQDKPFSASYKVNILAPKFELNLYRALFLNAIIRKEKYRYSYGRKWGLDRMKESIMKLPACPNGSPDWKYMEDYIKSLPYTKTLLSYV
ncbi:restriction endonuclease subunit S [Candidatus Parcubacteria bacterium]|nr:restriction endonuclease subunit S [Candidatus Parcubacteria bacterium]